MLTRDEILAVYTAGPEAVVTLVQSLLDRIEALEQQVAPLTARVAELEGRAAKDSHNSSRPPTSDGLARKPRSLRRPTGRKPGGQPGHPGTTLCQVPHPDTVIVHRPERCAGCGAALATVPVQQSQRRQVHDLPPLRLQVTEHQAQGLVCPRCRTTTTAAFPAGVTQPVQYGPRLKALSVYLQVQQLLPFERTQELLEHLWGCRVSPGTLATSLTTCAARLGAVEAAIQAALRRAAVVQVDETGLRIGGKTQWLHHAGTATLTLYAPHPRRGQAGSDALGVLPGFTGTTVHDAWAPYFRYAGRHALCNAHHLRELTFVAERTGQEWASELIALLLEIKAAVAAAREREETALPMTVLRQYEQRYAALIAAGLALNPAPPGSGKRGRPKQSAAKNLLDRLDKHRGAVLAFMHDFAVPFDNNLAERDLRMMKLQQKIAGCFRSAVGAQQFCRIRSYLSTLRKQGANLLEALHSVFSGEPFLPQLAG